MAFIGKAGQIFEDVGKTITDDILGIDDSGGIIGSASNVLAQLDDTTRDILSNETIVTLTSIVLASNPATAWAVPLVQGASVAAQGGDIRDVLEASAKAYVAQQIGAEVGAGAEAAAVDAGFSATAGAVLGSATGSAAGAAVVGGDPKQAFITGGVTAAVPRIMYQSDTLRDIGQRMQVEDGMRVRGEQGPILNPVSVTERAMFNVIQGTATAALTGQDVDDALLASVIKSADLTANVIKDSGMLDDLSEGQAALVTDVVNNVARSALTGGNMDDAVMQAVTRAGAKALQDVLDQGVRNTIDNVSGAYEDVYGKARELEATDAAMQTAQTEYNRVYDRYEAERDALTVKRNLAVDAQARINKGLSVAQANAIIADYNAAVAAFDKKVKNYYNPELSAKGEVYQTLIDTAKTQTEEYNVLRDKLVSKADQLDSALNPVYSATNEFFVNAMDPDFNEVQYREINDIPDDVDAYEHWLEEGQFEGLKTNDNSLDAEIDDIAGALTIKALDDIADVTNYSSEDIADLKGKITADLKNKTVEEIRSAKATDYVNIARDNYTASDSVVSRASIKGGVTREDVVNGNARLVVGDNGLLQWDQVSFFGTPRWSAEHGQLVYYKPTSFGQTIITDLSGTKILERLPIELQIIVGGTLAETQTSNPNMFIETATELLDGASEATKNQLKETLGEEGYDYVANTLTAMKKNVANSYIIKSFAAAGIRGAGEISKAANDTLILAGINPSSSPLGKAANDMLKLGEKSTPQEFADRIEAFKKDYDSSEGPLGKLKAISDGFRNSPFEMLVNFVGVELFPEIVPVLVGGVASVATKVAVKNAVKNATEESIKAAGKKAGLTASGITDIIESVGGNAGGAYDEALQVALDSGMSEAEAYDYAYKVATSAGILGGMTTMVSMGVVGQPLAEAFLGGNKNPLLNEAVLSLTSKIIKAGGSITIKEGLTESLEEATVTAFKEVLFYEKDPTRDVSGNIVGAAALAFISGGGTAGSIYGIKATGDMTSNAVRLFNRDVDSIISNSENSQSGANTAKQQLDDLGVTDSQIQGNLLNEVYDAGYTNQNEAVQSFNTYEYYTPTAEEISSFVGDVPDNVRDSRIESYIDPRYVDADEVRAIAEQEGLTLTDEQIAEYVGQKDESSTLNTAREAFDPQATTFGEAVGIFRDTYGYTPNAEEVNQFVGSIPEADQKIAIGEYVNPRQVTEAEARAFFEEQGYTATDEEIQQFVGEVNQEARKTEVGEYVDPRMVDADEVRAIAEQEGLTLTDEQIAEYVGQKDESSTLNTAREAFDPQATTYEEAEQIFRDTYGYTPNAQEVNQFVDNIPEADQKTAIGEYVNPRQVTEAEARAFFEEQGYTATGEEIQQFVGQVNQEARKTAIGEYVNPRQVTEAEARAFFEERGYTATDEEIQQFVGQVNQEARKTEVGEYVDPRMVDADEIRAIAEQEGLTLTDEQIAEYVGQKDESSTLNTARKAFDPQATTYEEAEQIFRDTYGYTPNAEEVNQFVDSIPEADQKTAIGEYVNPRQVTEAEARAFFEERGYTATDEEIQQFVGQVNQEARKTEVGEYVDPRMVDADEVRAAYETLGITRPTEADVEQFIGQYAESDLAGRAEEYLPTARYNSIIEQLDALAENMGQDQEILEAITASEEALGEQITDVEASILKKVAEYEEAGAPPVTKR
jgi:limonene-1,2-epoxide hydrolase/beta-phosphoglucomutase-like phosphatase (HAD superfamily)